MSYHYKSMVIELRTAQKLFLDKAEESRKNGNDKGLLIFATGLGKTLASLSDALKVAGDGKILVLAHNHNLLYQHAKDFKSINKTKKIGFLYSSKKDVNAEILFANIMTLKQKKYINSFEPDEFDYIIVDETHHAGAKSYKIIFDYFKPKFLLGMTATPNRTDQIDILPLYDNNIIINIDVCEAINKGWLRPYKYIFLWDKWCDYKKLKSYRIKSGHYKYDVNELGRAYCIPERDNAIVHAFKKNAGDRRGIGFCVSVDESIRMANLFNENGISAVAVWGSSKKGRVMKERKRNKIFEDYENGKYQIIFNCEIIGEGLHLPSVDVVLKLRPTQSSIKDNQHNGRGLYNIEGLELEVNYKKLLIIDLVGNYNQSYRNYIYQGSVNDVNKKYFDLKELISLPIGCEVEFEKEVITEFKNQYNSHSNYGKTIEDAIKEFEKIYGDRKIKVSKLRMENFWIYYLLMKNNLLEKYSYKKVFKNLNDAISEFKKIYGNKKVKRVNLLKNHPWIYFHFMKNGLLYKYCNDKSVRSIKDAISEFKKIYGNKKIKKSILRKENGWIFGHLQRHNLLDKYCISRQNRNLNQAIKEFKKIYGNKKIKKGVLFQENSWIYQHFLKHSLLDKYCLDNLTSKIKFEIFK